MFYDVPRTTHQLPEVISIFPLTGVVLLPRCKLPLNIFEPRYLNMVFDSLKNERFIGMVQPQPGSAPDGTGLVYTIGGMGRITAFEETADGRALITLTGLSRFQIREELEKLNGYRRVRVDWLPFAADLISGAEEKIASSEVMELLMPFFNAHGIKTDWHIFDQLPGNELLDMLIMNLPFAPEDKQALLEAVDAKARLDVLSKIATLYAANLNLPSGTRH